MTEQAEATHRRLVNRVYTAQREVEEHGGRGTGRVGELIACATELRDWLQQEEDAHRG